MTFSPDPVTVTSQAGLSTSFTVTATPQTPSEFAGATTVYGFIYDPNSIVVSTLSLANSGGSSYTATLYTSATKPAGTYSGSLQLSLCADVNCEHPFQGSPWNEPYTFTITAAPTSGPGTITTAAGDGTKGYTGDGGLAPKAELYQPVNMIFDGSGNYYFTDFANQRVRKVTPGGIISTIAGTGAATFAGDGGPATFASLNSPWGIAMDASGDIYIADSGNNRIRKISGSTTVISTYAGAGNGGLTSSLSNPSGLAIDGSGNLYICDTNNNRVIMLTTNNVATVIAGTGIAGYKGDGGSAAAASLNAPEGIALDSNGNIYIADFGNNVIREISNGIITTIAGTNVAGYSGDFGSPTAAKLNGPRGVTVDANFNVYIADYNNDAVRKISGGIITTIAGSGRPGYAGDNGPGPLANLTSPSEAIVDSSGNVYITDTGNNVIRKVAE